MSYIVSSKLLILLINSFSENLKDFKILTTEEMKSIEGGSISLGMGKAYLKKSTCRTTANRLLNAEMVSGMTQAEIAKEIFAHAQAYYHESQIRSIPGIGDSAADYIVDHADPIDITDGGDKAGRKFAYTLIWEFFD